MKAEKSKALQMHEKGNQGIDPVSFFVCGLLE